MNLYLKIYSEEVFEQISKALSKISAKEVKGSGTFEVIATTSGVDRDGESILIEGWDFENYKKNPIILFGHNYWDINAIVGAATDIKIEGQQVVISGVFADTEAGQHLRKLYDDGIVRTVSVGFIPKERKGNVITKAELLELSFVPVPANPEALSLAKSIAAAMEFESKYFTKKEVVTEEDTPTMDESAAWDATAAIERYKADCMTKDDAGADVMDWEKFKKAFAWVDSENAEAMESYKYPHHDFVDGELKVNWLGTEAAMTALLADTELAETDRQGVYDHLKKHYDQFGKDAPELTAATTDEGKGVKLPKSVITQLKADMVALIDCYVVESKETESGKKSGRVLSAKNKSIVETALAGCKAAIQPLEDLLSAVDTEKDAEALKKVIDVVRGADKVMGKVLRDLKKAQS